MSKYKDNKWMDKIFNEDIYYNVNSFNPSKINYLKGETRHRRGFEPRICLKCSSRFDGKGGNQVVLPKWFDRLPIRKSLCTKCIPPYKIWYKENKESLPKSSFRELDNHINIEIWLKEK